MAGEHNFWPASGVIEYPRPVVYTKDGVAYAVTQEVYMLVHLLETHGPLSTKPSKQDPIAVTQEIADAIAKHPEEAKRPDGIIPFDPPFRRPWWSWMLKALP